MTKTLRRKVIRNPTRTTVKKLLSSTVTSNSQLSSTTTVLPKLKPQSSTERIPSTIQPNEFNYGLFEDVASVLPAFTSAKPRKSLSAIEATTQALKQVQQTHETIPQSSFDKILEQQYKIKGIEENYEDEKLIGVLGSQVRNRKCFSSRRL